MPETWILDSSLGKYLNLCLWGLNKKMRVSWRINFFVPSLCVNDELSVVRNGGQQVCIVYCGREAKLSKGIVLLIICQTASHLQGMTGKQLRSVLLSAPSAPVKSTENSPCNFISEAQRILLVKWSDRSISFGVCSEMRVGLDWVCSSFFQMTSLLTAVLHWHFPSPTISA